MRHGRLGAGATLHPGPGTLHMGSVAPGTTLNVWRRSGLSHLGRGAAAALSRTGLDPVLVQSLGLGIDSLVTLAARMPGLEPHSPLGMHFWH